VSESDSEVSRLKGAKDKCGSYLTWSMQIFWIPTVRTPRKTKIMHFTTKQNNVQTFVNVHTCPLMFFCRQYFLQPVFVRFYFLVKFTAGKVSIMQ